MVKSSESVVIDRPSDEVFAFIADLRNEPSWHEDVESVPEGTEPLPVAGKSYPVKFKPFMGKTDGVFTALEVQPGRRIVYSAALGSLAPQVTYDVTAEGDGTRFTRSVDMHPKGFAVLMAPMMALIVPRRNKVFVGNLKRVLES
jgi:uncharacterized protein YndB with AHSA1/START domain